MVTETPETETPRLTRRQRERLARGKRDLPEGGVDSELLRDYCRRENVTLTNEWFIRDTLPTWTRELLPRADARGGFPCYLEVGVCEGASMHWALSYLGVARAVGIDSYQPPKPRQATAYARHRLNAFANLNSHPAIAGGRASWELIERPSTLALADLITTTHDHHQSRFDLIYVDGDHRAHAAITDAVLCWQLLELGGYMVLDDYNRRWQRGAPHAHEAIDAFLQACETRYDVVYRTPRQVCLAKTRED